MNWDEILGQQQDDIARQRYGLVKTIEGSKDFQDCHTPLDVYCKVLELKGEEGLKACLTRLVLREFPRLADQERWISEFVDAVRKKDQSEFNALFRRAVMSAL